MTGRITWSSAALETLLDGTRTRKRRSEVAGQWAATVYVEAVEQGDDVAVHVEPNTTYQIVSPPP